MVRLSVVEFLGIMFFCLHGSEICTVGLSIGLCLSFKTSHDFTVRWPAIACRSDRFAALLVLEWLKEKYVVFRHLARFCRSYIRSVVMFHMTNTTVFSQYSVILDMRPHRRWVFIVVSHFLCKGWFHACQKFTPLFINAICHKTEFKFAWNKSQPFFEHVITKLSTVRWEFWLLNRMQKFKPTVRNPVTYSQPYAV